MAEAYICRSGYQRYCVGDIFVTTRTGNPADLLGYGTWQQIKDRFLLAAGDSYAAGSTGGEAEHTLTIDEMPSHRHTFASVAGTNGECFSDFGENSAIQSGGSVYPTRPGFTKGADYGSYGYLQMQHTGNSQSHNNMPPYLVVNMWIRVA